MKVSVIICTHNRAENLRRTLAGLCQLIVPAAVEWELLVVDNNSTDLTRDVCQEFQGRLPLRYLFELRQGKSCALNFAIRQAGHEFLLFTDDDVDVDPHWLSHFCDAARRQPDVSFYGGRIIPHWECPAPEWMNEHSSSLLRGVAVHYDVGSDERLLTDRDILFFGANLAFHRRVFATGQQFREDIGPKGGEPTRSEETDLIREVMKHGGRGLYVPAALVHHRNPPTRMTEQYVRQWFRGFGICQVRVGLIRPSVQVAGAPLKSWFWFVWYSVKYGLTRWTGLSWLWLRAETKLATHWGIISEFRRNRHHSR